MKRILIAAISLAFLFCGGASADFSYQSTSTMTGGSLLKMTRFIPGMGKLREPQTSTVLLKGNRLAMVDPKNITVYDLDKQTMTSIDLEKKTYAVLTFEEFKQAMLAMQRKLADARDSKQQAQVSFKVDIKETGQTKIVNGMPAREFLMLLSMEAQSQQQGQPGAVLGVDSDMWMADNIAGYDQIRDFYTRMGQLMNWVPGGMNLGGLSASQPGMSEGMAEVMKQAQKLKGVPVQSVTRMKGVGMTGPGGEGGEAEPRPSVSESAGRRIGGLGGSIAGGALGGMLGRRKKQDDPKQPESAPPAAAPAKPGESVLLEITTDYSNFSSAPVDASRFEVPAGFKQVEHDMKKAIREMQK
jgi:hypothetical protein